MLNIVAGNANFPKVLYLFTLEIAANTAIGNTDIRTKYPHHSVVNKLGITSAPAL